MSSRRRTVDSHPKTLSENEDDENIHKNGKSTEPPEGEICVEPNTSPTENAQKNPLQMPESSYSEIFTG